MNSNPSDRKFVRSMKTLLPQNDQRRRGAFMVLAAICLVAVVGFVAFSVDLGVVSLTKTNLQKAADAAALAAAQEIIASVEHAGEDADADTDVNSISIEAAKLMAAKVGQLNGVYIDPSRDVAFGRRLFNEQTEQFEVAWGDPPYSGSETYNVVRVTARRDNPDSSQPDGVLELFFAPVGGTDTAALSASAVAFVEARDIVSILDFSGSMNYDSQLNSINDFGRVPLESNIEAIYDALQPLDLGCLEFAPEWLTVVGQEPATAQEAQISVTFKDQQAYVNSDKQLHEVMLVFEDGQSQYFDDISGTQGTFQGSGDHNNKPIFGVWVRSGESSVTVEGQPSTSSRVPYIEVTFEENSIHVVSTKDLSNVVLEFDDGVHQKFDGLTGKTGTFAGTGSNEGKAIVGAWIKSGQNSSGDGPGYGERFDNPGSGIVDPQYFEDNNPNVREAFCLDDIPYPYASGSWDSYINYVRTSSGVKKAGYRKMYGGMTFVDYLLSQKPRAHQTADLWKTPHYPFHAMKNGMSLFLDFLDGLEFGDHVGLVTYDSNSRVETYLEDENGNVLADLGQDWITDDYDAIDTMQRRKQAGHYDVFTGLGYGIEEAVGLLDSHRRPGSRPTLLVMTDGQANRSPNGWSLPGDWDWHELTDYDGNGVADYTTSNRHKQYAFYQAKLAIDRGYTVHTLSVGGGADRDLMKAIAFAGQGEWINVPGGTTIAEIEEQMLEAFARIAANVPPAKLLHQP